jgi:hypothetical protein
MVSDFSIENSYRAVSRYFDKRNVTFDRNNPEDKRAFDLAYEFTKKEFLPYMENSRVMGIDEAIEKTSGDTSAGYPFKFQGMVTKDQFFDHPRCYEMCAQDWENCAKEGYHENVIYDNIDKEEIRPQEKLDAKIHRSIMCPPADHLITGQRLFADMNSKFVSSHLHTASAVGLPKTMGHFHRAVTKLGTFQKGFAGDEKAWDATLPDFLMEVCRDLRIEALPSESDRIYNYYMALIYTKVRMPDGTILYKRRGNPSGSVNTSYDNTIMLYFLLAYCWIKHCNDSYASFCSHVVALLYGDDNTFTVHQDYINVYNLKVLGECMAEFGVELKNPNDPPKHYSQLDFLSCTWKKIEGYWVPVMDNDKLKMGMYYSEYPLDAFAQAQIILNYIVTNPFGDGFYKYCKEQLNYLYPHMSEGQRRDIHRHLPTERELYILYTGVESDSVNTERMLELAARERNFNSTPLFKRVLHCKMTESSNAPTQVLHENLHTKAEVKKGKEILDSPLISEDARHWLIRAVDPFHDTPVRPTGYPDLTTVGSVVQEINMSTVISAPPPVLNAGTNWDCHIYNLAHFASNVASRYFTNFLWNPTGQWSTYPGSAITYGDSGFQILTAPTGVRMLPTVVGTAMTSDVLARSINVRDYVKSKCRVVGMGFEVVNTTADIYLQGLVTAYRMPQTNNISNVLLKVNASTANEVAVARILALPPISDSDALALPGSKQWEARYGSYSVCTMTGIENPVQSFDNLLPFYVSDSVFPASTLAVNGDITTIFDGGQDQFPMRYFAPYNTSGVYYTGLSAQTTLQLNIKVILEAVPGPRDAFATLAQPSTQYSPETLRLYGELIDNLPVGVPFTDNPSGEWFNNVLGTVGELASSASAINPLFGLVGAGLQLSSRMNGGGKQQHRYMDYPGPNGNFRPGPRPQPIYDPRYDKPMLVSPAKALLALKKGKQKTKGGPPKGVSSTVPKKKKK